MLTRVARSPDLLQQILHCSRNLPSWNIKVSDNFPGCIFAVFIWRWWICFGFVKGSILSLDASLSMHNSNEQGIAFWWLFYRFLFAGEVDKNLLWKLQIRGIEKGFFCSTYLDFFLIYASSRQLHMLFCHVFLS